MGFKMRGTTFYGKSPFKEKKSIVHKDTALDSSKEVDSEIFKTKKKSDKDLSDISIRLDNVKKTKDHLFKEHDIYKGKKLSLKGQLHEPKANIGWDGGPTIDAKTKASFRGDYKLGKKTTLSAGANIQNYGYGKGSFNEKTLRVKTADPTSQPFWAGVKINI